MEKIIAQSTIPSSAYLSKLKKIGINFDLLSNAKTLGQLTSFCTGLLAKVDPKYMGLDNYGNPFIILNNSRISLAAAIKNSKSLLVNHRKDYPQEFQNDKIDIISSVGFGLSTWNSKVPSGFNKFKIKDIYLADYLSIEHATGDFGKIIIPVIIVTIDDELGIHGMELLKIDYEMITSKTRAFLDSYS